MATKTREMADSMHYESRQLRDALAASNARLKSARSGRVPADLQPQVGAMMLQEWEGLSGTGHLDQGDTMASGNPLYEQMRSALLAFEREAGTLRDAEQRDMRITAAYKWFSRHKPQGPEADPITAAVLASSLAVEANAAPPQPDMLPPGTPALAHQHQQLGGAAQPPTPTQCHNVGLAGPTTAGNGLANAAAMPGPYGKHYFFDVYSRASVAASGGSAPGTSAGKPAPSGGGGGGGAGSGVLRPASARGPSPGSRSAGRTEEPPSLSVDHPLGMYPAVGTAAAVRSSGGATAAAATVKAAGGSAAAAGGGGGPGRARFASTEMYAPAKLVRPQELDELDHRAVQVAAAAAAATEEEEVRSLRNKWSAMESKTNKSVADVQTKVAEWTLQRARLEEEIVRRQEAGRIAPLNGNLGSRGSPGGAAAPPWQVNALRRSEYDDGPLGPGSLSPYANANADLAAATAAAATSGPGAMSFMGPTGGGLHSAAAASLGASMRQRHADVARYDTGRSELLHRLISLGVAVKGDALDRALRPLEDRPFLDCIARLPKPGDHLPSRPGSVRLPAAKKKRSKSAGRKRPTSGTR
ncbi:hypothetical protein VOLCADRAFT_117542 [Volvox carteri f. nagariensis]|uniref:Uncharacterized protein n=1 Tax=Volvox carteri f. nagariensis TaxID=3068 RepID=D8TV17_VOLCA|nr:uncharacterized protein VOLCADRAFT_117542 [Volvox carteri f. nagariensis]EFJ48500.1 hypothetical protein VOLCADRAFT_117542 [Volvox carteri f. nagariensis]|eukprot:XP_002950299.1 hypothetical protein VOLCADRAFT_117542 [Volvox carteri f. nagariensis]